CDFQQLPERRPTRNGPLHEGSVANGSGYGAELSERGRQFDIVPSNALPNVVRWVPLGIEFDLDRPRRQRTIDLDLIDRDAPLRDLAAQPLAQCVVADAADRHGLAGETCFAIRS